MRLRIAILSVGILASYVTQAVCQVSRTDARQMGLETAWQSQVQLPRVGTGLVSSHLWVDPTEPRKFAVVELADRTLRVSADLLDRRGNPIGIEEAKKRAQEQAARILGKSDGIQVVEVNVPLITLVLVTSDGLVQALDAETGKLIWSTACGLSRAPAFPGAISPVGVTVIHGEHLYLLDWKTGKHLMSKPLRFSSSNSVAVCNDIAFVSDFTGRVEAYGLGKLQKPWGYVIQGRAIGRTVNTLNQNFAAIASDAGFVYVFSGGEQPEVRLRYETSSSINGSLAAANGAFYAGTSAGVVSKFTVDDRIGRIEWEFRLGQTVTAPPLVLENLVVVVSESGTVVGINDKTGLSDWITPAQSAAQPIAKFGNRLICTSSAGELIALDSETGRPLARTLPVNLSRPVINQTTDRIYLVTTTGQIQCLRATGAIFPTMIMNTVEVPTEDEPSAAGSAEPAQATSPFQAGQDNPFGGGLSTPATVDDPFGGDAGTDPFGGTTTDDPFGGSSGGSDPFSGDPFGGSGF